MFVRFVVEFKSHEPSVTFEPKTSILVAVEWFKVELYAPKFLRFDAVYWLLYCIVGNQFVRFWTFLSSSPFSQSANWIELFFQPLPVMFEPTMTLLMSEPAPCDELSKVMLLFEMLLLLIEPLRFVKVELTISLRWIVCVSSPNLCDKLEFAIVVLNAPTNEPLTLSIVEFCE